MRPFLPLALVSVIALSATSADAQYYRRPYPVYRSNGGAVVAGVALGMLAGAVIASSQPRTVYVMPTSMQSTGVSRWFLEIPGGTTTVINQQTAMSLNLQCRPESTIFGGVQMHCSPR